jgi:hypothetical protein
MFWYPENAVDSWFSRNYSYLNFIYFNFFWKLCLQFHSDWESKCIHNIIMRCYYIYKQLCCIFYAFQVYEPFIDGVFDKRNWTSHILCFCALPEAMNHAGNILAFSSCTGRYSLRINRPANTKSRASTREMSLSWVKMYVFSETFAGIARAQRRFKCRRWTGDKFSDAFVNYSIHNSSRITLNN